MVSFLSFRNVIFQINTRIIKNSPNTKYGEFLGIDNDEIPDKWFTKIDTIIPVGIPKIKQKAEINMSFVFLFPSLHTIISPLFNVT